MFIVIYYSCGFIAARPLYVATHLRLQWMLLNEHLVRISDGYDVTDEEYQDVIQERLKICIEHHCEIKRLHKGLVVETFFYGVIVVAGIIEILVGVGYFIIQDLDPSLNHIMVLILFIWVTLVTLVIYCGQLLEDEYRYIFDLVLLPLGGLEPKKQTRTVTDANKHLTASNT
ncbi:hypothetical protein NQ318_017635 [Aromia moschata]|uniref:Uncharacterized protein n=1 Tax=Aromia moschata TaxID=1265417 RepID=A0AAV8Z3Q5_9CUCU|nr:hypothetical protein NQ318_017635 [Aromia moschata]